MKFYLPLLMGLIMYSSLSFFWGRTGMQAQKELIVIRTELQKNLDELNRINSKLNDELNSLGSDPESIIIQSRNLSYIEADEKLLFVNLPDNGITRMDAGKFLNLHWVERGDDNLFKGISLFVFLFCSIIAILLKRHSRIVEH